MVEAFDLSVGLWVAWRGPIVLNAVPFEDSLEFLRSELLAIVGNDLSGFSVSSDDIFQ